jgi:hypothetical protein
MPADEARWQAHLIDDGPDEKLVFYCPECAEREFDAWVGLLTPAA